MTTTLRPQQTESKSRARELLGGLGSAVVLLAFLIGTPLALVFLGARLPVDWSVLDVGALTRPDDGRLLIIVLFAVGWLAWAAFTLSVAIETVALLRHVPAPHLPALGPMQRSVATLVAAAAVIVSPLAPTAHARAAEPVVAVADDRPAQTIRADSAPVVARESRSQAPEASSLPSITVERHDTLWGLAERHLGSGERYSEIVELNRGVPQPHGRRLDGSSRIYPGWVLRLPADAAGVKAPEASPSADGDVVHVVEVGDTLWDIAEEHLGEGSEYPEIFEENQGVVQSDGRQLTDPDLILAGWELSIPVDEPAVKAPPDGQPPPASPTDVAEAEPEAAAAPAPPPRDMVAPEPPEQVAPPSSDVADEQMSSADIVDAEAPPGMHAGLIALGLSGAALAGFVAELGRRRRQQQRSRRHGERIPMPNEDVAVVERDARALADLELAERLRVALRCLATSARDAGRPIPDVAAVRVGPDGIALQLWDVEEALSPFTSSDGQAWLLDETQVASQAPSDSDPYPALATLGVDRDDVVLLNLESFGSLAVKGEEQRPEATIRAIAADLAMGQLSPPGSLTLVDAMSELAPELDPGIVTEADEAAALRASRARADFISERLAALQAGGLREARASVDDDETASCLVTVSQFDWPSDGPTPWSGVALVHRGDPHSDSAATLHIGTDGRASLQPLGWTLDPAHLTLHTESSLGTAMNVASRPSEPTITEGPGPTVSTTQYVPPRQGKDSAPRVLLLGRVEVQGARGEGIHHRLARATELVAYLMLNPGASRHEVEEALWSGRRIEPATRRQLISRTRAWLGTTNEGQPYLESMLNGTGDTVRLRPDVTCDWHDFQHLARRGLAAGESGLADLEAALMLIRGRPFLGIDPRRYTWAERHVQEMVSIIADAAQKAATQLLSEGEPGRACDAASAGLGVDQTNEALLRLAVSSSISAGRPELAGRLRDRFVSDIEQLLGDVDLDPETSRTLASIPT
jgi:nucleoid-associated protein YgaU